MVLISSLFLTFPWDWRVLLIICIQYVIVCVCVCMSQIMSCFLFPSWYPHSPCSFLLGVWTGRLLSPALPEEAAGPTLAQLPGHHWLLSVFYLLSPQESRWACATFLVGCASVPILRESWYFSDKRKCNFLSLSKFLCLSHCPRDLPVKWTTLNPICWKISLCFRARLPLCPYTGSFSVLRRFQHVASLPFAHCMAFPGLQRE